MRSKHDKSNGSDSSSKSDKYDKNGAVDHDDSMSGGGGRSRSGSPSNRNDDKGSNGVDKVDHDVLSIYIGNVDYSATEEELRNTFLDCGEIVRVTIIKNMKTGHPKGAAFIEFTDKNGVAAAMQLNGKEVKGRPLIVTSKKPRPENKPREKRPPYDYHQMQRGGPPQYSAYGGGGGGGGRGGHSYGGPSSRGGYYSGPGGHMGDRRNGPTPMQMDQAMQARMQPRYDPYRRPDFYDPYMMQRGQPMPQSQAPYYSDKMGGGGASGHHHGGGGGGIGGGSGGNRPYQRR